MWTKRIDGTWTSPPIALAMADPKFILATPFLEVNVSGRGSSGSRLPVVGGVDRAKAARAW